MKQSCLLLFALALLGPTQSSLAQGAKSDGKKDPLLAAKANGPRFSYFDGQTLVFVANGAGESSVVSDNLMDIAEWNNVRYRVQTIHWCRQDNALQDFKDVGAQLAAANRLANVTRAIRKDCPYAQIHFVGSSAGAGIVLAAAEMLPPATVDRVILLAAGVSADYDLRLALKATRGGIHNFWSSEDELLEIAVSRVGTQDGGRGPAAGKAGFRLPCRDADTLAAYRRVYQVPWNLDKCGSGGHNTWTLKPNLRKYIVPLFFQPPVVFVSPPTP